MVVGCGTGNEIQKLVAKELLHVPEERFAALYVEAGFDTPVRFFQSAINMGWMTRKK